MSGNMQAMIEAEIAKLEAYLADLDRQRQECVGESTALPGRDAGTLRDNYYREEARRSGLRGIDSAIDGAQQQLAFYRNQLA